MLCSNIFHIEVVVQVKVFVKEEEVFGITVTDGGPIIGADHPVLKETFAIPIAGALCCSLIFRGLLLLNPLIAGLGGQVISNQRFCLRRRNLKGREKLRCCRTGCIQASKSSSIFSVRTALHHRQFSPCSFDTVWNLWICSYWESSRGELLVIQQSVKIFALSMLDISPARAPARARAHPGIHKRTLCGCSYWESSRGELLAIQQSVKIFALSMLDIPPARACARES